MSVTDIVIVIGYLLASALIPLLVGLRQKNKEDFMLAGKKMHWFPLALSGVAASFSAISLLGAPGFVMGNDMRYLPTLFVGLLSIPIVFFLVVPFLYKLSLVSVYEYLEDRFCPALRYAASAVFMISKLGYLSLSIFTPSLALSSVTGLPVKLFIVIFGLLTTFYTMIGGLEGVIWCDVMQYVVMVAGIAGVVIYFVCGDIGSYWQTAELAGKTKTWDFDLRLDNLSVWVLFLNCTFMGIAGTCSDQSSVQRLLSAKSLKDSMRGYLFSTIFGMPIVLVLYFIGACLYGFFHTKASLPPEIAGVPDKAFPYFIGHYLPPGVAGILLAAILAAGMSTISVVLHSLTSLFMVDVYEKITRNKAEGKRYVSISRCVTLAWGVLAVILAFFVMHVGNSIVEVSQVLASLLSAPLGGIFMLGIFTRRTNVTGAVAGGIAGFIATAGSWALNFYDVVKINFMWYAVFGLIATLAVGYIISLLTFSKEREFQK